MKVHTNTSDVRWWFWAVTLIFIAAALFGWNTAYYFVIIISGIQVLYFWMQEQSLSSFPTQIRIIYFAFTLLGLWPGVRIFIYLILLFGTLMVTFFNRCAIALVLKQMPWNRDREVRLN